MSGSEQKRGKAVTERLLEAMNAHDLEGQPPFSMRITEVTLAVGFAIYGPPATTATRVPAQTWLKCQGKR
jgi:hypothetical protein